MLAWVVNRFADFLRGPTLVLVKFANLAPVTVHDNVLLECSRTVVPPLF